VDEIVRVFPIAQNGGVISEFKSKFWVVITNKDKNNSQENLKQIYYGVIIYNIVGVDNKKQTPHNNGYFIQGKNKVKKRYFQFLIYIRECP